MPPSMPDRTAVVRDIEPRVLSGRFWHQGATRRPLLFLQSRTRYDARYHRAGGEGAWYASSKERAAWGELFRHHQSTELSPFEIRRRVGRVGVEGLRILDLADPAVQERLGLTAQQLIDDDMSLCQTIADEARAAGFEGILGPSAALPGEQTLVVLPRGMARVTEEHSRVQRPPSSLHPWLGRIRMAPDVRDRARRRPTARRAVRPLLQIPS